MIISVIDGQGGKIGSQIVSALIRAGIPSDTIRALGTNTIATSAMLKAGAIRGATGENAIAVAAKTSDVITGPIGILVTDALHGEITKKMTKAISRSPATRVLIPVNQCQTVIAGVPQQSVSRLIDQTVEIILDLIRSQS